MLFFNLCLLCTGVQLGHAQANRAPQALAVSFSQEQEFYDGLLKAIRRECLDSWCTSDFDFDFQRISCESTEATGSAVVTRSLYTCRYHFTIQQYLLVVDDGLGYGHLSTQMQAQCEATGPMPDFEKDTAPADSYWSDYHFTAIDACIRPMISYLYQATSWPDENDEAFDE